MLHVCFCHENHTRAFVFSFKTLAVKPATHVPPTTTTHYWSPDNNTMLNLADTDWCRNSEQTRLNLTQFWDNRVHSPTGTMKGPTCRGGNNTVSKPQPVADSTAMAEAILAPYPRALQ